MTIQAPNSITEDFTAAKELLVIGPNVKDIDILLTGLARPVDILRLAHDKNPLEQIAEALIGREHTDVLHLLAHGEPGAIHLGGEPFDLAGLYKNEEHVHDIRDALAGKAKIALWACSVAWMETGERFVEALTEKLCATVFASNRPVGAESLGGDWRIGTASPFMKSTEAAYPHTLPLTVPATPNIAENDTNVALSDDFNYTHSSVAGDKLEATIVVTGGTISTNLSQVNVSEGDGSDDARLVFRATDGEFNDVLDSMTFTPASGANSASISIDVNPDNASNTAANAVFNISINEAPTLGGTPADDTATEDVATAIDLTAYNVADADGDTITLTLAVDRGAISAASGDGTSGGVTVANSGTASMTLEGSAANLNTFLDNTANVLFQTASNDVNTATLTVTPNDGTVNGTADTVSISITPQNDSPAVSGLPATGTVIEDTQSNIDLSAASFSDVDSATITVRLTASAGTFTAPADGAGVGAGVDETLVSSTVVTLAGTPGDIGTYLDTVSNIQYTGASNVNGNSAATITVAADDGDGSGSVALGTVDLNITAVNDAPTFSGLPASVTFNEDASFPNLNLSTLTLADVDTTGDLTLTLTANSGTLGASTTGGVTSVHVSGGVRQLVGTISELNTYLDGGNVAYNPVSNVNGNNADSIAVTINDGNGSGDVNIGTIAVNITAVADAPTSAGNTITLNEDTSYTFKAADFAFADADTGDTLANVRIDTRTLAGSDTLRLSGTDVTDGQVIAVADIGNLVYTPQANAFGTGRSSFTFSVQDNTNAFAATPATLTLNVTDVAESVVIVTPTPTNTNSGSSNQPEPVVVRAVEDTDNSNDTLEGANLNDTIEAGGGDDTVFGGDGQDSLTGGEGNDTIDGGNDDDFIDAGVGDDTIDGGTGQDSLFGGAGNDTVRAGEGNDLVKAGDGDTGDDLIMGDLGDDTLGGGAGNDEVDGGTGTDLIWGREGDDSLSGGDGDDIIFNGEGDDTVIGGAGKDTVWAGDGDDMLTGGDGQDTFIFGKKAGKDTISDFDVSEDTLDLRFAVTDFADVSDVQIAASTATQNGVDGVLIALGGDNSVFVAGLGLDDLTNVNFSF